MARREGTTESRFWAKVDRNGPIPERCPERGQCWIWTGSRNRDGYGRFQFEGRLDGAHRAVWIMTLGPIPPETPCVLHRCDNPPCVNPTHLWVGTHKDNMEDKERKKRGNHATGDRQWTRLYPERVLRGDNHPSRLHPERMARGDRNGARTKPESRKRGDAHWARLKPERLARGDRNGMRLHPESVSRGERVGTSKLTEDVVREIRARRRNGDTLKEIARDTGVCFSTVSRIDRRETWAHVD